MEQIMIILAFSAIVWFIVDKFKGAWNEVKFHGYITTAVVAVLGGVCVFGFGLDAIHALGLTENTTIIGEVLTTLTIMTGASGIAEIIDRIKGK